MTDEGVSTGRREYLRGAALAAVAGLAGCTDIEGGDGGDGPTATLADLDRTDEPTATPTATATPSPTASPTPEVLATVSGTYRSYRFDAGRRAFAPGVTGPRQTPSVAYALDLPGPVYQPVLDGRRLYLAWRRSGPDTDGTVAWSSGTGAALGFAPPAVGERVYALGERGVAALDTAGNDVWSVPLTARPIASAAADESAVYLPVPRDLETTDLLALSAEDGSSRWRAPVRAEEGFPPVRTGDAVYVTSYRSRGGITAVDAADGQRRWKADVDVDRTPAVTGDRVVAAGGSTVFARSRADGSADWSTDLAEPVVAGPVADRSSAYVGVETDDGGALHALALDGGTVRWTLTFDRPPGTPTVVDDALLVPVRGDDGERLVVLTGP
ncbi:hypothetical protein BRC78_06810 [Halobacteriales archaeon QH_8_68_33]|nr:MAG: hypothetical protein BRC78_06810 [Halobacteriales archaeon QH_8_68_33]